jgi:folate-binding protein YgfZ
MTDPATVSAPAANDPAHFAALLGASPFDDTYGVQARFADVDAARLAAGFVAPLTDLGVLEVAGADAVAFLHGQLTNDVEHLPPGEARWYGYCTPKGRLLATFLGWREADGVRLAAPRPQAAALVRRLSMFVLRAKAKVTDRGADTVLLGVGGAGAADALAALGFDVPGELGLARAGDATLAGLPGAAIAGAPCPRWLLCVPAAQAASAWGRLTATLAPASSTAWRWTEVLAGIPRIVAGASEQFVPQMINFEAVGGVSFKKGCYPGQEIVARSQYLGKLKRRMYAGRLAGAEPAPGADVVPAAGGEPCGQVVMAAPAPGGGIDVLFESRTDAFAAGGLTIGGEALTLKTLPYALPA